MFRNISFWETLKFENVTGNKSRADAKIAGITPAEFIFNVVGWANNSKRYW